MIEALLSFFLHTSTPKVTAQETVTSVITVTQVNPSPPASPKTKKVKKGSLSPSINPSPSIKPTTKPSPTAATQPSTQINLESVLAALNNYRAKNGAVALSIDNTLHSYAQTRVDYLKNTGKLDNHAGHQEFMKNDGFTKLGFNSIAENQSWNYKGTAEGLISQFYSKSIGHNKNQLNPEYTHVGIGINGPFTNIVFGGRKR